MRYVLLNNGFSILGSAEPETIKGGTLRIELPFPCTITLNGAKYDAYTGIAYIPVSVLKSINAVRITDDCGRSHEAERFRYDNGSVTPCGYDFRETIIALMNMIDGMKEQIADMRHILVQHNEAINQSELF